MTDLAQNAGQLEAFYDDGVATIYHGDCRDVLPALLGDQPGGLRLGRSRMSDQPHCNENGRALTGGSR